MVQGSAGTTAQDARRVPVRPFPGAVEDGPFLPYTFVFDDASIMDQPFFRDQVFDDQVFDDQVFDEQSFDEQAFHGQAFDDAFSEESLHDFLEKDPLTIARALTELNPTAIGALSPEGAVRTLGAAARLESWLAALKARIIHRVDESLVTGGGTARQRELAAMNAVSETACILRVPEGVAGHLVNESIALVRDFPATLQSLENGHIHYQHAQAIIREGGSLPAGARSGFEDKLLQVAPDLTRVQLAARARRLRECEHPEAQADRRRKAELERRVYVEPAEDGMAYLGAFLPAESALALFNRVSEMARSLQDADESRTLGQLRADVLTDLVVGGGGSGRNGNSHARGVKAQVLVTIPMLSLLGRSDAPADLEGYGPIPADVARQLAAGAPSLIRLLTDPVDGVVLNVGRRRYRVPKGLRTYIRVRDRTCRFPGCNSSAARADLDHTVSWEDGGPTNHDNLASLCRKHHRMKHEAGWSVRQHPGSTLEWFSPTGRRYSTTPEAPPSNPAEASVGMDAGMDAEASVRVDLPPF
ncbi:HNH endonuclease signature motif containing protein [Arthrobacter sp. Br18]|uniref:HNH endonuclease signature motif containing protein n=1 Tax=Arthrobacter sp. Br18 TaxID=1312954 RepID=UPI0004B379E9|nr:HNH endonuclease signature motif containing protein [Arthrobacter sp. Br18]